MSFESTIQKEIERRRLQALELERLTKKTEKFPQILGSLCQSLVNNISDGPELEDGFQSIQILAGALGIKWTDVCKYCKDYI